MVKSALILVIITISLIFGNFSNLGPFEIEINDGYFIATDGESTEYRLFSPIDGPDVPHIIFAHEFVGSHDYLIDFSKHFASWGLEVATMNLMHSSFLNNDPIQDAEDLILLSDQILGGGPVVYVGYSAGGLRAMIASALDISTVAFFGLDIVDLDALGQSYVQNLDIPIFGLAGEASLCNSQSNGADIYIEAENSKLLRVTESDHCDFQSPNSFSCIFLCENENNLFSSDEINLLIKNLSTAFLTWQTSINMDGESWWTNGSEPYDSLLINNSISELVTMNINDNHFAPENFVIYQNYPNPFNLSTKIRLDIKNKSYVKVNIYDLSGRIIKQVFNGAKNPGIHVFPWDSKNNFGGYVSSGVYIYEIKTDYRIFVKKMVLLK